MANINFPSNFLWGAATASYQIEGAVNSDGRGASIWDTFSHIPGKIDNNDTGDVACDHYNRYISDIEHMKALGLQSYRTSIAWSRIFPEGKGQINQAGLDFYDRLTDKLLEASIKPIYTLFHWDLPQKLQDLGGFNNRDLIYYFRDYAQLMFEKLGDRVHLWITHNEPAVHSYNGHIWGDHAPGIQNWKTGIQVSHHLLLSHALAVEAFRQSGKSGDIGITLNLTYFEPASDTPADQAATIKQDGFGNRWFLDPLFRGAYPADILALYENHKIAPDVMADDLARIKNSLDFLGINYYFRFAVSHQEDAGLLKTYARAVNGPFTAMGWEIHPQGLYHFLTRIKSEYANIPIYITENGAAFDDVLVNNTVQDDRRIDYLEKHFAVTAQAIADGVDVRGYYVWSLLDNFEWAFGYNKRFGIIYVDYETQQRYWKQSAYWYRDFIAAQKK